MPPLQKIMQDVLAKKPISFAEAVVMFVQAASGGDNVKALLKDAADNNVVVALNGTPYNIGSILPGLLKAAKVTSLDELAPDMVWEGTYGVAEFFAKIEKPLLAAWAWQVGGKKAGAAYQAEIQAALAELNTTYDPDDDVELDDDDGDDPWDDDDPWDGGLFDGQEEEEDATYQGDYAFF